MIRKILVWILLGVPPALLLAWSDHPGRDVPKWLKLVAIAPLLIAAYLTDDPEEEALGAFGNWLLVMLGLSGTVFGLIALALKDTQTWIGLFWWMLPAGLVITAYGVIRSLRD